MKKFAALQVFAGLSFFVAQVQADPVGAAALALGGAVALNVTLGFVMTFKRFGGTDEFNGPFSLAKVKGFLSQQFATSELAVLAASLLGSLVSTGLTQQALSGLFIAGSAAVTASIIADNARKFGALVAGLTGAAPSK